MAGIAHFAFGFAAKPLKPKVPLAVWLVGSELLDVLAITFSYIGLERPNEAYWTHSLLMAAAWGLAFGAIVGGFAREWKAGAFGFGVVLSHWVLDAIVWPMTSIYPDRPDAVMPFAPGNSAGIGLGLYRNSAVVAWITELGLFLGGAAIYAIFLARRRRAVLPGARAGA
jgi:membrane-bound metal-dependent hydrolase YbcI (DUF457 family)